VQQVSSSSSSTTTTSTSTTVEEEVLLLVVLFTLVASSVIMIVLYSSIMLVLNEFEIANNEEIMLHKILARCGFSTLEEAGGGKFPTACGMHEAIVEHFPVRLFYIMCNCRPVGLLPFLEVSFLTRSKKRRNQNILLTVRVFVLKSWHAF
jgi:hypothetical protein